MDDLATLIADALLRFETVDLSATPQLASEVVEAFKTWDGSDLVSAVRQRLETKTAGQATVSYADRSTFAEQGRGAGAYLLLTRRRRLFLFPSDRPILFDS